MANPLDYRVTAKNIGHTITYDAGLDKIVVDIDGVTLKKDAGGTIQVDPTELGLVVVSTDAGNVLTAGADTGAMLTKDNLKTVVGEMVISSTDGIDYDALTNTLEATLLSMNVADSDSVDLTVTDIAGDISIKADVKISSTAGNSVIVDSNGIYVPAVDSTTNTLTHDSATPQVVSTVDGVVANLATEDIKDMAGNIMAYGISV